MPGATSNGTPGATPEESPGAAPHGASAGRFENGCSENGRSGGGSPGNSTFQNATSEKGRRLPGDRRLSPYGDTTETTRRRTVWVVLATGLVAAACLAWSLRIPAGDPWFYPATFILAGVYIVGSSVAVRMTGERLPWGVTPTGLRDAVLGGAVLAAVFIGGGFMVRFVPPLAGPVHELLDHARVGGLLMVAVTTAVNGVAEETYYRGALWRVLPRGRRILVTTLAYTAVTALAGIPLLALAAAVLGAFVGWLRERTRSLVPSMVAHLIWSLTMLFVLPSVV